MCSKSRLANSEQNVLNLFSSLCLDVGASLLEQRDEARSVSGVDVEFERLRRLLTLERDRSVHPRDADDLDQLAKLDNLPNRNITHRCVERLHCLDKHT